MTCWETINMFGAVVHDGLYQNEAELIARQHGLRAREDIQKRDAIFQARQMQHSKGAEFMRPDDWYEVEVKRLAERAPA